MQRGGRKRKQSNLQLQSTAKSPKLTSKNPFLHHLRPTPEECVTVRDDLLSLHGFPKEFVKYRNQRLQPELNEEKECVLDGLVKTILSQNTTETNSDRAFASLKAAFPTWELDRLGNKEDLLNEKDVENKIEALTKR